MMKNKRFFINIKGRRLWLLSLLCIVALFLAYCGLDKLTIVSQPTTAVAGQTITVTLLAHDTATEVASSGLQLVIGILVPKSWHAGAPGNTTVTFTSTYPGDGGSNAIYKDGVLIKSAVFSPPQTMSLIPSTVVPQGEKPGVFPSDWPSYMMSTAGLAGNLLSDMEWVAFWSTNPTPYILPTATYYPINITIQTKVGPRNTLVKLAYFASFTGNDVTNGNNPEGAPYSVATSNDCFSVTGGTNPLEDFCDPPLSSATPGEVLQNDVVTLGFDMNIDSTALFNASSLYICDTAFTTTGQKIPSCFQTPASACTLISPNKWQFEFWPRKYFNLQPGQTLDHINYYFTDKTGNIKVGFNSSTHPPTSVLSPFTLYFQCD